MCQPFFVAQFSTVVCHKKKSLSHAQGLSYGVDNEYRGREIICFSS